MHDPVILAVVTKGRWEVGDSYFVVEHFQRNAFTHTTPCRTNHLDFLDAATGPVFEPGVILLSIQFVDNLQATNEPDGGTAANSLPIHILDRRIMKQGISVEKQGKFVGWHDYLTFSNDSS